ncbi:MAG: HAD family hydrolase [Rhodobacteraceae bacterium]|nr:HAD family hydrolase [Paracoccaceae bacterium]
MIDGVIFDKDGTLFDFRASWGAWAAQLVEVLAGETGIAAGTLGAAIGFDPGSRRFAADSIVIAGTPTEIARDLATVLPGVAAEDLEDRLNRMAEGAPMLPAVDLAEVLSALRARGLRIGLATNDNEEAARAHLAAHGITELFDYVAGYDSGHGPKPGPGMCAAFARQHGLDPARVVMVGDSRHDLEAGRRAGMRAVAVLTGIAGAAELAPHADAVLPDIAHLGDWIDSLAA